MLMSCSRFYNSLNKLYDTKDSLVIPTAMIVATQVCILQGVSVWVKYVKLRWKYVFSAQILLMYQYFESKVNCLHHRYINFTFNVGGAVKILVHWLNLGRKLVLFHIFKRFCPIFSIIWYICSSIWQISP